MLPPTHYALHHNIDPPLTSLLKSITGALLMNAPNIAVNHADVPRPSHVLSNEVNEVLEKLACSAGRKGVTLFEVEDAGSGV